MSRMTDEEFDKARQPFSNLYRTKRPFKRTRRFIDAPTDVRCQANITLKDGSLAQCGRRECMDGLGFCWQHQRKNFSAARSSSL